jgi:heme-degrading monooxygenase HmoA
VFARLVRYKVEPDRSDEALAAFRSAADEIGSLDGFEGGYVLSDAESGHIYTLTLWTDRAALEASEVRASRLRQGAVRTVEGDIEAVDRLRVAQNIGED